MVCVCDQKKADKAFMLLKYDKKNPECGGDYIRSPLAHDAQPGRFLMKLNSIFPTRHSEATRQLR